MVNLPSILAGASALASRVQTYQTHTLPLRVTSCFVFGPNTSISLSLTGELPQDRVDYTFYSPSHVNGVEWSTDTGFILNVNDTDFFTQTGSWGSPIEAFKGVDLGKVGEKAYFCLKTNNPSLPTALNTRVVMKVYNGLCFSEDQSELIAYIVKAVCSMFVASIAYWTGHSSIVIWREVSMVIFGFFSLPFVYYDTHLFSSLSTALQNVLMTLYFPVDNFWTPIPIILSLLDPGLGGKDFVNVIYLFLLTRYLIVGDFEGGTGPLMICEILWKLALQPLLVSQPFQQMFVAIIDTLTGGSDIFEGNRTCGYGLEYTVCETSFRTLLIVVTLLVSKPRR